MSTAPAGLPVALLLPGQGAQFPGMGTGLYRADPEFAALVDEVLDAMGPPGTELRSIWLAPHPGVTLDDARRSQPLLFALGLALGRLLTGRGLRPAVLLGHSVGELAAATLAGVVELPAAVRVLQHRVAGAARLPRGGMFAVAAGREQVTPHLRPGVDVGAVNAPRQTVIAGAEHPLRGTVAALRAADLVCAPVASQVPFHSAVLQPLVDAAEPVLRGIRLRPPRIPLVSGYTGRHLTDAEATDPGYWARHPVDPVLWWPALETLLASGPHLLVECGPGQGLTTLARRHPDVRARRSQVLSLLGPPGPGHESERFAAASATLDLRTRSGIEKPASRRRS